MSRSSAKLEKKSRSGSEFKNRNVKYSDLNPIPPAPPVVSEKSPPSSPIVVQNENLHHYITIQNDGRDFLIVYSWYLSPSRITFDREDEIKSGEKKNVNLEASEYIAIVNNRTKQMVQPFNANALGYLPKDGRWFGPFKPKNGDVIIVGDQWKNGVI